MTAAADGAPCRGASYESCRRSTRVLLSSGAFNLVGKDEMIGRNFPSLTDFVNHVDRERAWVR